MFKVCPCQIIQIVDDVILTARIFSNNENTQYRELRPDVYADVYIFLSMQRCEKSEHNTQTYTQSDWANYCQTGYVLPKGVKSIKISEIKCIEAVVWD